MVPPLSVATTFVEPLAIAVTTPEGLTVATAGVRLVHTKVPATFASEMSLAWAVSPKVAPIAVSVSKRGVIVVDTTAPPPPFAVAVSGDPVSPTLATVSVCAPAAEPSVQTLDAFPAASVTALGTLSEPPPVATTNVTVFPLTPLPSASTTCATIGANTVLGEAVWKLPAEITMLVAGPGVIANDVVVALVNPLDEATSV